MRKDVKKNLLSHSEAKVNLLGEYINRFLNIICNDGYTRKIYVYDLFCGEGIYVNGGEGSPMVLMRAVKDVHFKNVARKRVRTKIDCFFNDIDNQKVEKARKSIYTKNLYYPDFGEITFSSQDYKDFLNNLPDNLLKLKEEKAFIFLDPYEYKHIKMSHLKSLMANKKSEVLLWLPTQFMYRFEKNGTPTALKDFIEELVPFEKWNPSQDVWKFVEKLKENFQIEMGKDFYVDNFTIKKDNNTVFCLFFFTSHIKGFEKMLESKWKIDTIYGKGWHYTGNQVTLFSEAEKNPLEEKLKIFLSDKIRNNSEIYEFTLRQGYLPKHTTEVFTDWQKNSILDVQSNNGKQIRRRAFYISYPHYKEEPSKASFKIN